MDEQDDQEHWTIRRQRAVRCKIHGLHYDPTMTSGCSLCRKEGITEQPRSRPQLIVFLLALLGLALVIYRMFGPGGIRDDGTAAAEVESPGELATSEASSSALDPELYREQLEALEQALFEPQADELGGIGDAIVTAAADLSRAIRANEPQAGRHAMNAIAELRRSIEGDELTLSDLKASRESWSRLRPKYFRRASWLNTTASTFPPTDRASLTVYRSAIDDLLELVSEGSDEARTLAALPEFGEQERGRRQEQWWEFARDWRQRLDQLERQLPERPTADSSTSILLATQRLEEAFTRVRSLAADRDLPFDHGFGARFEEADALVERARMSFDDLLRK
ncbi:MAG: hypothetical protein GY856_25885 [bacterium]|nr:hypothetical protein [bacterium]